MISEANHSRTGSPCPVLQQEAGVFTPLSSGEGMGLFICVHVLGVGGEPTPLNNPKYPKNIPNFFCSPPQSVVNCGVLENRARRPCSTIVCMANLSRTVVSVPRPPAPNVIHSPAYNVIYPPAISMPHPLAPNVITTFLCVCCTVSYRWLCSA